MLRINIMSEEDCFKDFITKAKVMYGEITVNERFYKAFMEYNLKNEIKIEYQVFRKIYD